MEVEEREGGRVQRKIIIAMITSGDVLARIAPKWNKEGLFESKWCNIVGGWCVRHYNKYGKPPGRMIEHRFDRFAEHGEKDTVKLIQRFLSSISSEYKRKGDLNHEYIVDLAAEHFNQAAAKKVKDIVEQELDNGKIREAVNAIKSFDEIDLGPGGTVNVLFDEEAIRRVFAEKRDSLIKYPGALGQFFGRTLCRDSFVAFVGPEKSGKSFWLLDIGWRAMIQRLNVAYYVIGDMSEDQVHARLIERASKRPIIHTERDEWVSVPTAIERDKKDRFATVLTKDRQYKDDLDWREAVEACRKVTLEEIKSKEPKLKLKCFPAGSIDANGVKSSIEQYVRGGWFPDVAVVDYADNLAGTDSRIDVRHQIGTTWRDLRSISQIYHCLLVTATQTNAKAYNSWIIGPEHFSESKVKNAQVTGMIGINQMDEEMEADITRLNWVERRSEAFSRRRCVYVAGCREIANIAMKSCW